MAVKDRWASGDAYEPFMGRSRRAADRFIEWLRHRNRPRALSRALGKAMRAELTRPEATRCRRFEGAWIVDVTGYVRKTKHVRQARRP